MSGGWNPAHGYDAGPRPNFGPAGQPLMREGQAYVPHVPPAAYQGYGNIPAYSPARMNPFTHPGYWHAGYMQHQAPFQTAPGMGPPGLFAGPATQPIIPAQPNGTGFPGFPRAPQPIPNIAPKFPAAALTNSTGGIGSEPGYNYFFPAEHTKIHVYTSKEPPWRCNPYSTLPFFAAHVPCNTTLGDILKGFGATNPIPKKNKCYEITPTGNGHWYKGLSFSGDQHGMMSKTIKDIGWDKTRTGLSRAKPAVCIWLSKD